MYAVVKTSGRQFRVEPGATITVDRLQADEGSTIKLDRVLLIGGDDVQVGEPTVDGASVTAKVLRHGLGDKALTFKYRRRHRTRRRVGYRPSLTVLEIVSIDT